MIFYNKYKKFRLENRIDLKDVSKRTKIDLKYLKLIEGGKFSEIPNVYVTLFFKAYISEIGVDLDEAINELDSFLNKAPSSEKLKSITDSENKKSKIFTNLNSENLFNSTIFVGIALFIIILSMNFSLNSDNQISKADLENEIRISKSDLIEFYSKKSEEVLSLDDVNVPITIRFQSNNENYINFYDNFSGKEFFIFEESMSSNSNTFTEQWNGEEKTFLVANTLDFEFILFSDDIFNDFSNYVINEFPIEIKLNSNPYTLTVIKYLPNN